MADERRLIDANALLKKARRTYPPTMANSYGGDNVVSVEDIEKTPTVDAVEVVRCKECTSCCLWYPEKQAGKEAIPGWYCKEYKRYRRPDDFCSYGERRAEDGH